MSFFRRSAVLLMVLTLLSLTAVAQTTGVLRGRVLDPSGAFVPKASITVSGPGELVKVAETDDSGTYSIQGLAAGSYRVRASAAGFSLFENSLEVPSGRVSTLDIRLSVEADRQEVTVEEQTQAALDPASNASAIVMKGEDLDMLSNNSDDLQAELLALAGPAAGPNGGQIFVDGFSNGQLPPKESIREIRINSNPFSAEFDRSGQGRVEIFTKPGTDRLRGSFNFNYGNNGLNARNPYSPSKPPMSMQQYQANLGGSLTRKASFNVEAGRNVQNDTNFINAQILDASFQPVRYLENVTNPNVRTSVSPRVDYALSPNITLQGRYNFSVNSGTNNGVGGFTLLSRANHTETRQQGAQMTMTAVLGTRAVFETRFQYNRSRNRTTGVSDTPTIQVLDAFTGGGANAKLNYNDNDSYELQNYLSYTRGAHFTKFGGRLRASTLANYSESNYNGTYTFTSITAYSITQQGLAANPPLSIAAIRAQGGGARQFSMAGGIPLASVNQVDVSPFVQDDWRIRPNVTLSLGLRYEIQTNISDRRAVAPRIGLAWGLGKGRTPKTVLRAGFGMYYERFGANQTLTAQRQNGVNQQTFVVLEPPFFDEKRAPTIEQLNANRQAQAIYKVDSGLIAPRMYASAFSLERQLPKNLSLSISYNNTRGTHQLRSRNINAPLPGSFTGVAGSGVYPFGAPGQIYLYESSAIFKQQQISATVNARMNAKIQLFGYYAYGRYYADADGSGSFPADNYNTRAEWGRAGGDVRHRTQLGGNVELPFRLRLSPNVSWQSAPPLNITSGQDLNGDTNFNDRPAFATDLSRPSVRVTRWGIFDSNPLPGAKIIPRNYGTGFGRLDVSGRLSRSWSFGERATTAPRGAAAAAPNAGGARNGNRGGGGNNRGGGGGNGGGRWNLTLSIQARNAINTVNAGLPNGNLSSQFFGQALNISNGGSTANRRVELNMRFDF